MFIIAEVLEELAGWPEESGSLTRRPFRVCQLCVNRLESLEVY
jgi:hypothetical protein